MVKKNAQRDRDMLNEMQYVSCTKNDAENLVVNDDFVIAGGDDEGSFDLSDHENCGGGNQKVTRQQD